MGFNMTAENNNNNNNNTSNKDEDNNDEQKIANAYFVHIELLLISVFHAC